MNTYLINTAFDDHRVPSKAASPSLKPIPKFDELDEEMNLFRVLYPAKKLTAVPTQHPEKLHPVLKVDRTVVSASLIRRIESELINDECDPRTVFNYCRGLTRGTREFEDAYISARIRCFAKHQRIVRDPLLVGQIDPVNPLHNPFHPTDQNNMNSPLHPLAVNHLGHLMSHFGIWVTGLLGIQLLAAWNVSAFANKYLEGGRLMHFSIVVFLILAIDSAVWFRRRGHLCDAFLFPGAVLFLMALLPLLTLYVKGMIPGIG